VSAGLVYWQVTKPGAVVPESNPEVKKVTIPAASSPSSLVITPPESKSLGPAPSSSPGKDARKPGVDKAEPALASLLPPKVNFTYKKGGSTPRPVTLGVNRSPLRAVVRETGSWLSAEASNGHIVLDLNAAAATLSPGQYHQTVQITSNRDSAVLDVSLSVAADVRSDTAQPATPPSVTPPKPTATDVPKSAPPAPAPAPAVKMPYQGPKRGTINWSGNLAAGARLVLGESGVLEGGGTLSPSGIPPTDVEVTVAQRGVEILGTFAPPNPQRVVIVNSSGAPVSQIRINWNIK
jgi:hypothetical protein